MKATSNAIDEACKIPVSNCFLQQMYEDQATEGHSDDIERFESDRSKLKENKETKREIRSTDQCDVCLESEAECDY